MMKSLLFLGLLYSIEAARSGLIRIPKEHAEIAVHEVFEGEFGITTFTRFEKKKQDSENAFRELVLDMEMSMSLSMSMPSPPGKATSAPTSTPLPPADDPLPSSDDPLDPDPTPTVPSAAPVVTSDSPSSTPTMLGDAEGETQAAATGDEKSTSSSAPQAAMISLLSLAAATVIVALIARKVYVNRKAAMAGGKSLSDQSVENSMDPSTEPGQSNTTASLDI